jgi:hypothetical protein
MAFMGKGRSNVSDKRTHDSRVQADFILDATDRTHIHSFAKSSGIGWIRAAAQRHPKTLSARRISMDCSN